MDWAIKKRQRIYQDSNLSIFHMKSGICHAVIYCLFPIIPGEKTESFPSLLFVLVRIKSWTSIAYCDIDYCIQVQNASSKYNVLLCWK